MGFRYDYVSMYIFEHGPMRYTFYECLLQLDNFSTYKAIHDFISLRIVVDVIFFFFLQLLESSIQTNFKIGR